MEFDFSTQVGTGISKLAPHLSPEVQDLITKMLIYNPDNRITASQTLKHAWFKELREQDRQSRATHGISTVRPPKFTDSISAYSKYSDGDKKKVGVHDLKSGPFLEGKGFSSDSGDDKGLPSIKNHPSDFSGKKGLKGSLAKKPIQYNTYKNKKKPVDQYMMSPYSKRLL